eukprot:6334287-Pyramimonas_sp.AAC.1
MFAQIFLRQKNCCSARGGQNMIKSAKAARVAPLTPAEVEAVREGLSTFGAKVTVAPHDRQSDSLEQTDIHSVRAKSVRLESLDAHVKRRVSSVQMWMGWRWVHRRLDACRFITSHRKLGSLDQPYRVRS